MSRFKNEVSHLKSHIKTLRIGTLILLVITLFMGFGWWTAPRDLTIHIPPDLRSGSVRKWWEVPPESVYSFTFYIFQQLHRWPVDGEDDYKRNIHALSPYFSASCRAFLDNDYKIKRDNGELKKRIRGIYEIPGRGYGDAPNSRISIISDKDWIVYLDVAADEYFGSEQIKRALIRYPIKVTRMDIDPEKNPFGLVIDCYDGLPQRISLSDE